MESLQVNREKLITQTEYAKMIKKSQPAVFKMMKDGRVDTIKIKGATLIVLP